jgi:outer membrane immunogenic protein
MRIRIKVQFFLLLAMTALSTASSVTYAQSAQAPTSQPHAELALDYSYLRSNAPPGGCDCFNLNGGSATFAWHFKPRSFALVGDVSVTHTSGISSNSYSLTLSTFTAGGRYTPRFGRSPLKPFGQILVGIAHSSGSLVEGQNSTTSNAGAAFAANVGGGIDLRASHRISFRLVEADYLVTTFDNGLNGHQNNLRLSTGVVLHF